MGLQWATLAGTYLSGDEQREAFVKARAAVDQALQLDPELAIAHGARGLVLQWADVDWTGAEAEYRRQLELAPTDGVSHYILGRMLGTLGHVQQSIPLLRQAIAIDPRNGAVWSWLAWHLAALGQYDEAENASRQAVALLPGSPFIVASRVLIEVQRGEVESARAAANGIAPNIWRDIAVAFSLQGGADPAAADAALKALIDQSADGSAYQIAEVYALRNDPDSMFQWLDRAWQTRDSGIGRLLADPFVLRYRNDPRFAAFCGKVRLPVTTDAQAMPARKARVGF
jgi:serine/threonine-protein kinase